MRPFVDEATEVLERRPIVGSNSVLKLVDRRRVDHVVLAGLAPLLVAANVEIVLAAFDVRERRAMTNQRLFGNRLDTDAGHA